MIDLTKIFKYIKGYVKETVLAPLFKLFEALLELAVPLVMAAVIDHGISKGDTGYIVRMCIILAALGVLGLISSVTAQYFAAKAAVGYSTKLRDALFRHILRFSYADIDRLGASTLITRMTGDVNQVQTGVNLTLRLLLRSPFVVFGAMIMAYTINGALASIFLGVIIALFVIVFGIMLYTIPMYRRVQGGLDDVTLKTKENLTGTRVIRAFTNEDEETADFEEKNNILYTLQKKVGAISALMNPLTYVAVNIAVVILLKEGAIKIDAGVISQGQMVALYNYMSQILVELVKMANLIITATKAVASAKRVSDIMNISPTETNGKNADIKNWGVELSGVGLKYNTGGDEALSDISFSVKEGQTVGIIGGTGSGKSSLINLISGFYSPSNGKVKIGGVDASDISADVLRDNIGIVPQKAVLFRGTIRDNLKWGNENATDEEISEALKISQAEEIVNKFDDGLSHMVEQGGANLSGGQRQRLTIARALVKNPKILILDDSASALDYATDLKLRRSISSMPNRPTTFIVSQRASSVKNADIIIVLDDGNIAGIGTNDELLETNDAYREIYFSQFSKDEV